MTEMEIRIKGMKSLRDSLGEIEAERFISLIQLDTFDYTEWQRSLCEGMTGREISSMAMKYVKENSSDE